MTRSSGCYTETIYHCYAINVTYIFSGHKSHATEKGDETLSYRWVPKIQLKLEAANTHVVGPGGVQIPIVLRQNAQRAAKIEGGVKFNWKSSPLQPDYYFAVVSGLSWIPLQVGTTISTDLYEVGQILAPAAGFVVDDVSIVQPTITITHSMQVLSIDAGKGVSVIIDCTAKFVPGKVMIDLPDITIPTTPTVTIPTPPMTLVLGKAATSRMMMQFDLIVTDTHEATEYDRDDHGLLEPFKRYLDQVIGAPGESDVRVMKRLFQTSGNVKLLAWHVTLEEGHASWYQHLARGPNGVTSDLKTKPEDWGLKRRRTVTYPQP